MCLHWKFSLFVFFIHSVVASGSKTHEKCQQNKKAIKMCRYIRNYLCMRRFCLHLIGSLHAIFCLCIHTSRCDFNMIFVVCKRARRCNRAWFHMKPKKKLMQVFHFGLRSQQQILFFWFLALSCDFAMGSDFSALAQYFKTYVLAVERNRFSFRHIRHFFRFYFVFARCSSGNASWIYGACMAIPKAKQQLLHNGRCIE